MISKPDKNNERWEHYKTVLLIKTDSKLLQKY